MTKEITPEMIAAWRTLQEYALSVRRFVNISAGEEKVAKAIDVLDNSDFMVPIEEAGECGDTSAGLPEPPCDLDKPCPVHDATESGQAYDTPRCRHCSDPLDDQGRDLVTGETFCGANPNSDQHELEPPVDAAEWGGIGCTEQPPNDDPGAPHGRGKCTHCGHPRVPLTPGGLTMYHGDVNTGQGDCLGSLQPPEQPLDPAAWGDTTREDMADHQIGLPELKPGQEIEPAFSDTHPRAARELGSLMLKGRDVR